MPHVSLPAPNGRVGEEDLFVDPFELGEVEENPVAAFVEPEFFQPEGVVEGKNLVGRVVPLEEDAMMQDIEKTVKMAIWMIFIAVVVLIPLIIILLTLVF